MEKFKHAVIMITVDSAESAGRLADILLENHKVACVNIVPRIDSRFRWEDKIDTEEEVLLIIKTRTSLVNDVINLVRSHHPYDVPEVIAMPIIGGNPDYLEWIDSITVEDFQET